MDCKACRKEIEEAAAKERPGAGALAHLESCAACRTFSEEQCALRELVSSLGTISAPGDFDWRLRARLAAEKQGTPGRSFLKGFAPGLPAIGLAASFALLIAAAILFRQADRQVNPPSAVSTADRTATKAAQMPGDDSVTSPEIASVAVAAAPTDGGAATGAETKSSAGSRVRSARAVQVKSARAETRAPVLTAVNNPSLRAKDFSSGVAPVVTLFPVPVRTPTQSLRVLLDEGRGTTRTVALQPVTFGAQKILERGASASGTETSAEEIW
ncbi:MAG TPA: hypothetical protein VF553_11755 [Pyrinomonadaceae bacterium]|jgi:hypothetical protein